MPDVQPIFVVLGYGCHLDARVCGYLEHAAARIRAASSGLVITSGGCTAHTSAPGITEAGLMADHLRALGVTLPMVLEDTARTTVENLRNVARMIAARGIDPAAIHIFGDSTRRRKIAALARYFFGPRCAPIVVEPYDLRRTFVHALVQSTIAVPFDLLVARFGWLERWSLRVVERRMRRS